MINKDGGAHLLKALRHNKDGVKGRFIPMTCKDKTASTSYCFPARSSDNEFVSNLEYTGKMVVNGVEFGFLMGEFGSWMNPTIDWKTLVPSTIGADAHCCHKEGFVGNNLSEAHALLCLRGECDFVTKAENAQLIGAGMMIVGSNNSTLQRMGADRYRGRKVMTTNVMIPSDAYDHLVASFYSKLDFSLESVISISHPLQFPPDAVDG